MGEGISSLETWIQFAAEAPDINDAVVPDYFPPAIDPSINWLHTRRKPDDLLYSDSTGLYQLKITHANIQRVVEEIDQSMLNQEQKFLVCIVENQVSNYNSQPILVIGGTETGNSTVVKILPIQSTVIMWFNWGQLELRILSSLVPRVIQSSTFQLISLILIFLESILTILKSTFLGIKVVIIDEVSMMGKK